MIDYSIIGKRIKKARLKSKLTQEKMAEILDISRNYLSKAETGKERPNLEMLGRISVITNSPLPYLITGVVAEGEDYLDNELWEVFRSCSAEKKKLIYDISVKISAFNDSEKK